MPKTTSYCWLFLLLFILHAPLQGQQQKAIACNPTVETEQIFEEIIQFKLKGDYASGLPLFDQIIQQNEAANNHTCVAEFLAEKATYLISGTHYKEALLLLDSVLQYLSHHLDTSEYTQLIPRIHNDRGLAYYYLSDFEQAAAYYHKAEAIYLPMSDSTDIQSFLARTYVNLGGAYREMGFWNKAITYLEKAREIKVGLYGAESEQLISAYQVLGMCYNQMEAYDKALMYGKLSLELLQINTGPTHTHLGIAYINIEQVYYHMRNYEEALIYAQKALDLWLTNYGKYYRYTGIAYNEVGNCYGRMGQHEKQLEHYMIATEIMEKTLGKNYIAILTHKLNMGSCYGLLEQEEKQYAIYQEVLAGYKKVFPLNHPKLLNCREKLADYYLHHQAPLKARTQADSILLALSEAPIPDSTYGLPVFSSIRFPALYFSALNYKAEVAYNHHTYDIRETRRAYQLAVSFLDSMQISYRGKNSRRVMVEKAIPLFEHAIDFETFYSSLAWDDSSEYTENAFHLAEKSRSVLLKRTLQQNQAREFAGIPSGILEQELQARQQLNYLEQKLLSIESEGNKAVEKGIARAAYLSQKEKYTQFIRKLETEYPPYYQLKYGQSMVSLDSLKQYAAQEDAQILSYFWGEDGVTLFVIDSVHVASFHIERPNIDQALAGFLKQIKDVSGLQAESRYKETIQAFKTEAYSWFQTLLGDTKLHKKRLIIIPDGPLSYLPFELLLTQESISNDLRELPYLLKDHIISYQYSADMILHKTKTTQANRKTYAGFAPDFKEAIPYPETLGLRGMSRGNFLPLQFNQKEVSEAARILAGETFTGETCTEAEFKQHAGAYQVLHVATHTFVNDQQPLYSGLIFGDYQHPSAKGTEGILHAYEIYNLELQAELVVLSACHTGSGKLARGEGIMSLDRAFRYAGCPSILTSLWQAHDESTYKLISMYFQGLAEGKEKDVALRDAKLQFLEEASPLQAFPYYWAGFIQIGEEDALSVQKTNFNIFWLLLFVGIAILFYTYWQKSQKN